jgi:hypothetical protein
MTGQVRRSNQGDASGIALLPRDLTPEELDAAPILESADLLLITDLTDEEDEAFARALAS